MVLKAFQVIQYLALGGALTFAGISHASSNLFLFADDLQFCSSDNLRYCTAERREKGFGDDAKQGPIYQVTEEAITRIKEYPWTDNPELRAQAVVLLKLVRNRVEDNIITERYFERTIRRIDFNFQGERIKGRDFWSGLFTVEKYNLFDLLEQKQSTRSNRRLEAEVSLEDSKSWVAKESFNAFFEAAQRVAGKKRKPKVVFVTGAERDPYRYVDYYEQMFSQIGFDAQWLPLDGAMQTALAAKSYDANACSQIEEFQIKRLASFRRSVLYPDLLKQQIRNCEKDNLIKALKSSDALFIASGSPLLTYHAFYTPAGKPSEFLTKLQEMFADGNIIVGAQGETITALAGGGRGTASILSGDSNVLMLENGIGYLSGREACRLGIDCLSLEAERTLNYVQGGILGLFPFGVLDVEMAERGNHTRVLKTAFENKARFAFGLDDGTAVALNLDTQSQQAGTDITVIGEGGFWMADLTTSEYLSGFEFGPIETHYLTHEDNAELRLGRFNIDFAAWKVPASQFGQSPMVTASQPYARNNFFKLNQTLCNTGATQALSQGELQKTEYQLSLSANAASLMLRGNLANEKRKTVCSYSRVAASVMPKAL